MQRLFIIAGLALAGAGIVYYFSTRTKPEGLPGETVSAPEETTQVPSLPAKSGLGNDFDDLIRTVANAELVSPAILKAIVAKESFFDADAINPEKNFTINGVTYPQYDKRGQGVLRAFIKEKEDPLTLGINPSLGLAQVRVTIGQKMIPGLDAWELFIPQTNLTASGRLLRELLDAGITLDTIDAYNVGQGLRIRNLKYRDEVNSYYARFVGDFS